MVSGTSEDEEVDDLQMDSEDEGEMTGPDRTEACFPYVTLTSYARS
jgi:hypothetical protein